MNNLTEPRMRSSSKSYVYIAFCVWIYVYAIYFGALKFLPHQIAAFGIFKESFIGYTEWILIFFVTLLTLAVTPFSLDRPSAIFVVVIYIFLYLPALVLYTGRNGSVLRFHELFLVISMTVGYLLLAVLPRSMGHGHLMAVKYSSLSANNIIKPVSILALVMLAFIFVNKYQTMRFVGLDDIYLQRELGAVNLDSGLGLLLGYSQIYLSYLLGPIILSYGFWRNSILFEIFGLFIFSFCYALAAERSVLVYPVAMYLIYLSVRDKKVNYFQDIAKILIILSVLIFFCSLYYEENEFANVLGFLFFTRLIAVPGQFIGDYYDFFAEKGYLFWSNFRGVNLFISPPSYFSGDPLWPYIGWIVGRDMHGISSNLNASFWATDGIAAAGPIGLILISLLLSLYLYFLDSSSRLWPREFLLPLVFPLAFVLTNGALLTTLLSYGGGALVLFLWFFGKGASSNRGSTTID